MNDSRKPLRRGRALAIAVLLLLLAVTILISWQQHRVAGELQAVRWREGFVQLEAVLDPLVNLQSLRDCAKSTLMVDGGTAPAWEKFLLVSEWQKRYAGLQEVGYLEPAPAADGGKSLRLKFVSQLNPAAQGPAFDPTVNPSISIPLINWYDHSNGLASIQLTLPFPGPGQRPFETISFFPLRQQPVSTAPINSLLPSPNGILFLQLDRAAYFASWQPQLAGQPIQLRLLAAGEPDPPRTATQRPISRSGFSGEWRFLATLKPSRSGILLPPWVLPGCGVILSFILYWLFSAQTRLRYQAEAAHETVQAREAEILALNRDLEEKIAERTAELNVALAEEKELNRLKTNFTSMVTHEIRTPLEIILSSADILLRYLDRLQPARRTEHLQGIRSAVQRMNALMSDVLLFSRAEAGRMEFNPGPVELGAFCTLLVDEIESASNRRCPVELVANNVSEPARADENLLRHILTNLLTNAVKYSPAGVPVKFTVDRVEGDAVFVVEDSGMGISAEDRRRIFTPFYRGTNVGAVQGTGLGLVIVKHCVERHGGNIAIESATGVGTKITVWLPLFSPAHTAFIKRLRQSQKPE